MDRWKVWKTIFYGKDDMVFGDRALRDVEIAHPTARQTTSLSIIVGDI
jgi:hypothetical protein